MKKCITFSLALLFCSLFTACFGLYNGEQATIIINLGGDGDNRALMTYPPGNRMNELRYVIELYRVDPELYRINPFNEDAVLEIKTVEFNPPYTNNAVRATIPVTSGVWEIQVTAYWYRFEYATNEKSPTVVQVAAGVPTPARIQMEKWSDWQDWISISSASELALIGSNPDNYPVDGNYLLTRDITINGSWTPIGVDNDYPFEGKFDGNGNTIFFKDVTQTRAETDLAFGLFGYLRGTVTNLRLEGSINLNYVSSESFNIGAVAGSSDGNISNVSSSVIINVSAESAYVGGIAGHLIGGSIRDCYSTGDITGTTKGGTGTAVSFYCGGIAGEQSNGSVSYCWVSGKINANEYVGGIAGYVNYSAGAGIENCVVLDGNLSSSTDNVYRIGYADGTNASSSTNYANFDSQSGNTNQNSEGVHFSPGAEKKDDWWTDTADWNINLNKTEANEWYPWWWNNMPILWFEGDINGKK